MFLEGNRIPKYFQTPKEALPSKSQSSKASISDCDFFQAYPKHSAIISKYQVDDSEHNGQHKDCHECVKTTMTSDFKSVKTIMTSEFKIFTLPRGKEGQRMLVPERYLEPGNSSRTFKNGTMESYFQW